MTSTVDADHDIRLELESITKIYPSVIANDSVSLTVRRGEIHALLGENGAGKTTLMKMIYGVARADAGRMLWEGKPVQVNNPAHARQLGIGMVFQHFSLFETLSVVENVALALSERVALDTLASQIDEVSQHYGLPVDPRRLVHSLSVGERQRVEIIRCLLQKPKLLIMDEPTSVLTPQAVRRLFATLRQLAAEGCSILYISHKLDEIQELCHVATVLRDGKVVGHCIPVEETPQSMASLMIGGAMPVPSRPASDFSDEVRLKVRQLSCAADDSFGGDLHDIELEVRSGEILGIAGVSGNGQQELLRALSGEQLVADASAIEINGHAAGCMAPGWRRQRGLGFVPEERLGRGAVPPMTLAENGLLTAYQKNMLSRGLVCFERVAGFAADCIERFRVKCGGTASAARSLSGGNLQRFIVGREISLEPLVLVVAQPTWGLDVSAAGFIRQELINLRHRGAAILVVSEELDELFEIADRIAVISQGRLSPIKPLAETSIDEVGTWMSGLWASSNTDEAVA